MNRNKRLALVGGIAGVAFVLAGCGSDNFRDVEGVRSERPDSIRVFNNVDQHPNIVQVCIDGVAFATTTRDYNALLRVEGWDKVCPKH